MKKIIAMATVFATLFALSGCNTFMEGFEEGYNGTQPSADSETSTLSAANELDASEAEDVHSETRYEITYSAAKTYKDSIGTVWMQAIFEIENTGSSPLYLSSGAYDVEDAAGELIASRTMVSAYPDVIEPGGKAYYYEETTLDIADEVELEIIPRPDIKQASVDTVRFPLSDVELRADNYGDIRAIGRIENNSDETQGMTYVAIVLYSGDSIPIGLIFTILMEDIAPGDKIGFEASGLSLPGDITIESIARYETFAYPLQFQF